MSEAYPPLGRRLIGRPGVATVRPATPVTVTAGLLNNLGSWTEVIASAASASLITSVVVSATSQFSPSTSALAFRLGLAVGPAGAETLLADPWFIPDDLFGPGGVASVNVVLRPPLAVAAGQRVTLAIANPAPGGGAPETNPPWRCSVNYVPRSALEGGS